MALPERLAERTHLSPGAAYDLSAPFYDAWPWQAFWRKHEFPVVQSRLQSFSDSRPAPPTLLDVGCGTGWYLERLAPSCSETVGADISLGMLAIARHRLDETYLVHADARALPFPADRFDVVVCTRMLSHLEDPLPALVEMRRVLSSGGLLLLSDVDAGHDYDVTRLPANGRRVLASTFKHARAYLFELVAKAGFRGRVTTLLETDGSLATDEQCRLDPLHRSPCGWVSAWHKASDADYSVERLP